MVQTHRIKTIAVAGCTAVGKSEIALRLAMDFNGELIGADSMQIYRGFDIGTGKLTPAECGGIVHKLIDVADGDEEFSAGRYAELAKKAISDTAKNNKLPIVVGGTGLYIKSLFSGCNFADVSKDGELRKILKSALHFFGAQTMHVLLSYADMESSRKIEVNDCKRVIRALEIYMLRGVPKSDAVKREKPFDDLTIVLTLPREMLYDNINRRVKKMFDDGLIEESKSLLKYKNCGSMQALGYKQIAADPDAPREILEQITAQKTRNYAKRQITFFKNADLNKIFIDARDYDTVKRTVSDFLENGNYA